MLLSCQQSWPYFKKNGGKLQKKKDKKNAAPALHKTALFVGFAVTWMLSSPTYDSESEVQWSGTRQENLFKLQNPCSDAPRGRSGVATATFGNLQATAKQWWEDVKDRAYIWRWVHLLYNTVATQTIMEEGRTWGSTWPWSGLNLGNHEDGQHFNFEIQVSFILLENLS